MLQPIQAWLFLQHLTWVVFCAPFVDLAEGNIIDENYTRDMSNFANWIKSIEGRMMPILCPFSAASPWLLSNLTMFRDYMPRGDADFLLKQCHRKGCEDDKQNGGEDGTDCGPVCGSACPTSCEDNDNGLKTAPTDSALGSWENWTCEEGANEGYCHYGTLDKRSMQKFCPFSCKTCDTFKINEFIENNQSFVDRTSSFSREIPSDDYSSINADKCADECQSRENCVAFEECSQSDCSANCTLYSDVQLRRKNVSTQTPKLRLFLFHRKPKRTSTVASASTPSSSSTSPPPQGSARKLFFQDKVVIENQYGDLFLLQRKQGLAFTPKNKEDGRIAHNAAAWRILDKSKHGEGCVSYGDDILLENQFRGKRLLQRNQEPTFTTKDERIANNAAVWKILSKSNLKEGCVFSGDEVLLENQFEGKWLLQRNVEPTFITEDEKDERIANNAAVWKILLSSSLKKTSGESCGNTSGAPSRCITDHSCYMANGTLCPNSVNATADCTCMLHATCASYTQSSLSERCLFGRKAGRARRCRERPCTEAECCDKKRSKNSLKLSAATLETIFDAIDDASAGMGFEYRVAQDARSMAYDMDILSIRMKNIRFPKTRAAWLKEAEVQTSASPKLSLVIPSTKVKIQIDTFVDVDPIHALAKTQITMDTRTSLQLPLPSLEYHHSVSPPWQLAFPNSAGACESTFDNRVNISVAFETVAQPHEAVPDFLGIIALVDLTKLGLTKVAEAVAISNEIEAEIKNLINRSLKESCDVAMNAYSSFARKLSEKVNGFLNKWQKKEPATRNRRLVERVKTAGSEGGSSDEPWSVSRRRVVKQWRHFLYPFLNLSSPLHFTKFQPILKKMLPEPFTFEEDAFSSVNSKIQSEINSAIKPKRIGLDSLWAKLVKVQLRELSSLQNIELDDSNEGMGVSIKMIGTFSVDVVVEGGFKFSRHNTDYVEWNEMEKEHIVRYKVSITGIKNPSFHIEANLLKLDRALVSAVSSVRPQVVEAFKKAYANKEDASMTDLINKISSSAILGCIAKHLQDNLQASVFKIMKLDFDAEEIESVHVSPYFNDKVSAQLDEPMANIFNVVYDALLKGNVSTLPKLIHAAVAASSPELSASLTKKLFTMRMQTTDHVGKCPSYKRRENAEKVLRSYHNSSLLQLLQSQKINHTMSPWCVFVQETTQNTPLASCDMKLGFKGSVSRITLHGPTPRVKVSVLRNNEWSVQVRDVSAHVGVEIEVEKEPADASTLHGEMDVVLSDVTAEFDASSSSFTPITTDFSVHTIFWNTSDSKGTASLVSAETTSLRSARVVDDVSPNTFKGPTFSQILLKFLESNLPWKETFLLLWRFARRMLNDKSFLPAEPIQLDTLLNALMGSDVESTGVSVTLLDIHVEDNISDIAVEVLHDVARVKWVGMVTVTLTFVLATSSASAKSDSFTLSVTNGGFDVGGHVNMDHHIIKRTLFLQRIFDALGMTLTRELPRVSDRAVMEGGLITVSHVDFFCESIDARVAPSALSAKDAGLHFTATKNFSLAALLKSLAPLLEPLEVPLVPDVAQLNKCINAFLDKYMSSPSAPGVPIMVDAWLNKADPMVRWGESRLLEFGNEVLTRIIGLTNMNTALQYPFEHKRLFRLPIDRQSGEMSMTVPLFGKSTLHIDTATPLLYSWHSAGDYTIMGVTQITVTTANMDKVLRVLVPRLKASNSMWIVTGHGVVSPDFPVSGGDHLLQIRTSGDSSHDITVADVDNIARWLKLHRTVSHELIFATPWNTTFRMATARGAELNATIDELQINGVNSMTEIEAPFVHMEEDVFLAKQHSFRWYAYAEKPSYGQNRRVIEMREGTPDNVWVTVRLPRRKSLMVVRNSRFSAADGFFSRRKGSWRKKRGWVYNSTSHQLTGVHDGQTVREHVHSKRSAVGPYAVKVTALGSSARSFSVHFDNRTVLTYMSAVKGRNKARITTSVNGTERDTSIGTYLGVQFRFVKSRSEVEVRAVSKESVTNMDSWTYPIMPLAGTPFVEITSPETAIELNVTDGHRVKWESLGAIDTMLGAKMSLEKLGVSATLQVSFRETAHAKITTFPLKVTAQLSDLSASVAAVVEVAMSIQSLTTDQFLSFPCLLSHARSLTKIHTLDVTSLLQNITIQSGDPSSSIHLKPIEREAVRELSHLLMSNYVLPAVDGKMQRLLDDNREATCPSLPWHAPNERVSQIFWYTFIALSFIGALFLIFGRRLSRKANEAFSNAETGPSNSVSSLHAHKALPVSVSIAIPILCAAYMCAFISSNATSGAIVRFTLQTQDVFGIRTMFSVPEFYSFSLIGSITDMWKASAYVIAIAVVILSAAFPYGKLLLLLLCWYVSSGRRKWMTWRRRLLWTINFLSKWSLLDFLCATIYIAANRQVISLPPHVEGDMDTSSHVSAKVYFSVEGGDGLYYFIIASTLAYALGYGMLAYHDRVALADGIKSKQFKENTQAPALFCGSVECNADERQAASVELDEHEAQNSTAHRSVGHAASVELDEHEAQNSTAHRSVGHAASVELDEHEAQNSTAHRSVAAMIHALVRVNQQEERGMPDSESNVSGKSWFQRCCDCGCWAKDVYVRVESGVMVASFLAVITLLFVGSLMKIVTFEMQGLSGWLLNDLKVTDDQATYLPTHLSLWDVANAQLAALDDEKTWRMYAVKTCFLLLTLIGPIMYFVCLMMLWVVPLEPRARVAAWNAVKLVDSAFNAFDVLIFTIAVSAVQFDLITAQVFQDKCESLNPLIKDIYGDRVTPATCVAAQGRLLPALVVSTGIVLFSWVVSHRASVLIERVIITENSSEKHTCMREKKESEDDCVKTNDDVDSVSSL